MRKMNGSETSFREAFMDNEEWKLLVWSGRNAWKQSDGKKSHDKNFYHLESFHSSDKTNLKIYLCC